MVSRDNLGVIQCIIGIMREYVGLYRDNGIGKGNSHSMLEYSKRGWSSSGLEA